MNRYRQVIGEDYFSVEHKGYTFVIANTSLWRMQVQGESETHDSWFRQTLAAAHDKNSPVFVVQHHPLSWLPWAKRNELLILFETSGVVAVLAGHTHTTIIDEYKGIQLVNGETTSKNTDGRPHGFRLWHVDSPTSITHEFIPLALTIPTADFNGDEIVDIDDLLILIEHWGTDEPLCDIGPTPFGDGIVDVADLEVLMSYWGQEVLPVSLLAYWKLDETEGDIASDSANDNDGNVYGDPAWQPTGGKVDGALQFDGIDDYVSTDHPIVDPVMQVFSVFAWIKGGTPGQVIISQRGYPYGANWLSAEPSEGSLMTELKGPARADRPLISQTVITDGQWHRVGFVWDGSQRMLYVDDVQVAADTHDVLKSLGGGLYIGAGSTLASGIFWSGLIDDVRIYDRVVKP